MRLYGARDPRFGIKPSQHRVFARDSRGDGWDRKASISEARRLAASSRTTGRIGTCRFGEIRQFKLAAKARDTSAIGAGGMRSATACDGNLSATAAALTTAKLHAAGRASLPRPERNMKKM